jgi:hypothetical protein
MAGGFAADPRGASRTVAGDAADGLGAPLFHQLLQRMAGGGRWVVVDLGAARSDTIRVLSRYRCRLDIVDLADSVGALNAELDARRLRELVEQVLPRRGAESIDLVLCWDLINYLTLPALTAVMESVAARCKRGALAHGLIYYSEPTMPQQPGCFVPLDDQRLANLAAPTARRAAPRYSPDDLARCMPRYQVERGRLLRNGMQEFLFRL